MASQRMPALQSFIDDLRNIWASDPDIGSCMEKAKPLLEKLVRNQELQARSVDWPSTEGRKNLLLYVDEQYEFAINAVVRVPGRKGSVHDQLMPGCFTAFSAARNLWSAMNVLMTARAMILRKCA